MSEQIRPEIGRLQDNIESVIKGKTEVVRSCIVGILARGHILLEDVPGVGKTTLAQLIARSIDVSFSRIQFTSDMLPSDILGVTIYDQSRHEFEFKPGPIFAGIVLADEINRTTPKTQSALLQAMNSAQVSIDKNTYDLPQPFMVLATQNPIEIHGTFPLPKSELDRFLMRLRVGYPELADEVRILRERRGIGDVNDVAAVLSAPEVLEMQRQAEAVRVDDSLLEYIGRICAATRSHGAIELGASPRAGIALRRAAQARAYCENRAYCIPDDIKSMAIPVLAHRIQAARTFDAAFAARDRETELLAELLETVPVPV